MHNNSVNIDLDRCNGCKKCVIACPVKVLELNKNYKAVTARPGFCVHCSHCMSVCPEKAISANFVESALGRSTQNIEMPSSQQVENLILTRRSIRAYSRKKIERPVIEKLLNLAAHSPTTHNCQNVKFMVAGPDKADELESLAHDYYAGLPDDRTGIMTREAGFKILLGAPYTIALYSDREENAGDTNLSLWNCFIEAQTLLIAAHGMGLGGCFNGLLLLAYMNKPELQKFFSIPHDKKIYIFVSLGYPRKGINYLNIINRMKPDVVWI